MFEAEGVDEREKRDEKRFFDAELIRLGTMGVPTSVSEVVCAQRRWGWTH